MTLLFSVFTLSFICIFKDLSPPLYCSTTTNCHHGMEFHEHGILEKGHIYKRVKDS